VFCRFFCVAQSPFVGKWQDLWEDTETVQLLTAFVLMYRRQTLYVIREQTFSQSTRSVGPTAGIHIHYSFISTKVDKTQLYNRAKINCLRLNSALNTYNTVHRGYIGFVLLCWERRSSLILTLLINVNGKNTKFNSVSIPCTRNSIKEYRINEN